MRPYFETIFRIHPWMVAGLVVTFAIGSTTRGQGICPLDLSAVGTWDGDAGAYADIWADGNVVYVAQFGDNRVHFFDITDPANPVRFLEWVVGSPNTGASAQDVKVGDGLLFIGLECCGSDGVEIVDVRDPTQPIHLSWVDTPGFGSTHNVFYDSGFLYLVNSFTTDVGIVDLTAYDPDNPPARLTTNRWRISVGNVFVHDITVVDDILYACGWDSGLFLYDVSDVANQAPVFLGSGPGNNTHAVWPSANGRWAVTGEERTNGPIKLYELIPNGPNVDVVLRDTITLPNEANSAHNPLIVGLRVYVSWYQAGLVIMDIDETAGKLVEAGRFDTFEGGGGGFDGAWGVYPFLGEDRLAVSDLSNGLFIIDAQPGTEPLLDISYPNGLVTMVHPEDGATLTVQISAACDELEPGTASLFVDAVPGVRGFTEIPLDPIGEDLFEGRIPGALCGSEVRYFVSADAVGGGTERDPPGAPAEFFTASVVSSTELLFFDNFDVDTGGWVLIVEGPPGTGEWERVAPRGSEAAPAEDYPGGEGTMCYVTEQGPPNGGVGDADVDEGPVRLVSPTVQIDGRNAEISYARWFFNNDGGQDEDFLTVEISGDGGANWQVAEVVASTGTQWVFRQFLVSEVMEPGETVTVRFTTSDVPNNSITEAGVDEFSVVVLDCEDVGPISIVHGNRDWDRNDSDTWVSFNNHAFGGYIDPKVESTDGVNVDLGLNTFEVVFNTEPFGDAVGGPVTLANVATEQTGGAAPNVSSVAKNGNTITVELDRNITLQEWTTLVFAVWNSDGVEIVDNGNEGEGVNEVARLDVAALPSDVNNDGAGQPLDLSRWITSWNGGSPIFPGDVEKGHPDDYLDISRGGGTTPLDLARVIAALKGQAPFTRNWRSVGMNNPRP